VGGKGGRGRGGKVVVVRAVGDEGFEGRGTGMRAGGGGGGLGEGGIPGGL